MRLSVGLLLAAGSAAALACSAAGVAAGAEKSGKDEFAAAGQPLMRFEAVNQGEPAGDKLAPARRIAAAMVAQDNPAPKLVVDVGSYTGEFLEAFLQRFAGARGQWTEPVDRNLGNAKRRLRRFAERVDYRIGCPARDISLGCVPAGVDVLITSWLSIHQDLDGINKFYREAAEMLPSGGWLVNLDHVGFGGDAWEQRFQAARAEAALEGLAAITEGPPVHHEGWTVPTLDQQLAAFHVAGIDDVQVVWRRFNTVLIMGRKK